MRVRLIKPWNGRRPGTILAEIPDGVGNVLLRRQIAELLDPPRRTKRAKPAKTKAKAGTARGK